MKKQVLFVHGAGDGAYEADALLADSLRKALGSAYDVRYPALPSDDSAPFEAWTATIERDLAAMERPVALVGHSVGASVLAKHLSEQPAERPFPPLFLLATPFWGADDFWAWDEARLSDDGAAKLARRPLTFYHSRDDETVPFEHLALYEARLPQASFRVLDGRGHQFGNDLSEVAEAIREA